MTDELTAKIEDYHAKFQARNKDIPEAGGIAYCTLYAPSGMAVNVTGRGIDPFAAMSGLIGAVRLAQEAFSLSPVRTDTTPAPAPKPDPAAKIAQEAGNQELASELVYEDLEVGPAPSGQEWITADCNRVVVVPQPDEKVTLEFYCGNDKYPKVKVNKWPWEGAVGLMRHVTSHDMSTAANLALNCKVYWTLGKEGTTAEGKTFRWKNVGHVRPL